MVRDGGESTSGRPLFGKVATLVVAACLIVPFAVKKLTDSEPYPAVIFPDGGTTVRIADSRARVETLALYGEDATGNLVKLDANSLLDPIPAQYFDAIAQADFGQDVDSSIWLTLRGLHRQIRVPRRVPSASERAAARSWMRDRLAAQGLDDSHVVLRTEVVDVDPATGDVLGRTITDEKVVSLD